MTSTSRSRRRSLTLVCVARESCGPYEGSGASRQTVEDLAAIEADLAEAERLRASAAARLAAVRARGDGELAVGMTLAQHLRHTARLKRDSVTDLSLLGDVLGDLPRVAAALRGGLATVDQAAAVAAHAARVGPLLRRAVDAELSETDAWHGWSPEHLAAEVRRMLASLTPRLTAERERSAPAREWVHAQPTLDGQGLKLDAFYEGLHAAQVHAVLDTASPKPRSGERRGPQLAAGLLRVLTDWATGRHLRRDSDGGHDGELEDGVDGAAGWKAVTIHLLVDESTTTEGAAAELWTSLPGLAPTITADTLRKLEPEALTITSYARDGVPVKVKGRAGHAIDDPDGLSWDSLSELVKVRQGSRCGMPGCDRPIDDVHHLQHRADKGPDRMGNLAGLCARCHHRVLHRHAWSGKVDHHGRIRLTRHGRTIVSPARKHLRLRRPPPLADPDAAAGEPSVHLDQHGDPLPF